MQNSTLRVVKAAMEADNSISASKRKNMLRHLADADVLSAQESKPDRLLKRRDVALVLGVSSRSVDLYAQRGILRRVRIPGQSRASGFLESEVADLLQVDAGD